jgi:hypothetical protein
MEKKRWRSEMTQALQVKMHVFANRSNIKEHDKNPTSSNLSTPTHSEVVILPYSVQG